ELFSVSEITFIKGRGEVGTLVSTRLIVHYDHIVSELERTMLGYELIKQLNKITEDEPEEAYFELLSETFEALNTISIPLSLIRFWFVSQLLYLSGHTPNLQTDVQDNPLRPDQKYNFSLDRMAFVADATGGQYNANHIKLLRLAFTRHTPQQLAGIQKVEQLGMTCMPLVQAMAHSNG
ncbi:MAG: DNA repair protein RecO C-terminal domain-containing protein, partial [Patescibacteria group bacterium]